MYARAGFFSLLIWMLLSLQVEPSSAGDNGKDTRSQENISVIDFRNGLLKVSVENQKFQKIMDEVAQKTGIRIVIQDTSDEDLTIRSDYLPLEKSLQQLLKARNYVFIYRSDEEGQSSRLMQVWVFGKSGGRPGEGPEGKAEKKVAKQGKRSMGEGQDLVQKMLDEFLQNIPQDKMDLKAGFYEALKGMPDLEEFRQMKQHLEDALKRLPDDVDHEREIYDAFREILEMEK